MDEWNESTVSGLSALTVAYTTLLQDYDEACCQLYDCNKKLDLCTMSVGGGRDDLDEALDTGLQYMELERDVNKRLEHEIRDLKDDREESRKKYEQVKAERDALQLEVESLKKAKSIITKEFETFRADKETSLQEAGTIEKQLREEVLELKNKLASINCQMEKRENNQLASKTDQAEKTQTIADQLKSGQYIDQLDEDGDVQDIIIVEHIDREFKSFEADYSFEKENDLPQGESEMTQKLNQLKNELEDAINQKREFEYELKFSRKLNKEFEEKVVELNKQLAFYKEEVQRYHKELEASKKLERNADRRSREPSHVLVELNIENQIARMPSIQRTQGGINHSMNVKK